MRIPVDQAGGDRRSSGRLTRPGLALSWSAVPMILFLTLPLLALIWRTELTDISAHLAQPVARRAIVLSLWTSATATLLTILLGTPLAVLMTRRQFRGRRALDTLIDLPTVLPPAVAGLALLMAFGRRGMLGQGLSVTGIEVAFTSLAVILAQLFVASPYYIRAAIGGLSRSAVELEEAAALDGADGRQIFRFVTVPLARASLLGGLVMTWARALGDFGATILFAGNYPGRTQTMPLAIYIGFELDLDVALALSVVLMATAFAILLLVKWLLGRTE
ncbi:MAG: molybdate ABC transporter permease subunit [Caldilineaceae bacterium SB0661_bin_32]|uniref:Molybdenum transport system permease n=1 Tax=Caldilineaceae bacterium SB0661_bin_32 TaxID=2605255 RepID=A0A6B1DBC5_9CHLR|nr:molybdate ABC transporter permease subunit [Caldilineaceae bacterium SB0661_bin_32]